MRPLRILVVEDDEDFAEGLADALELHGHKVKIASSGEQALELFSWQRFQLTLMDIKLPCMDGVESMVAIREIDPQAKVVMMTGYSEHRLIDGARRGGALEVIQKPFDIRKILTFAQEATTE